MKDSHVPQDAHSGPLRRLLDVAWEGVTHGANSRVEWAGASFLFRGAGAGVGAMAAGRPLPTEPGGLFDLESAPEVGAGVGTDACLSCGRDVFAVTTGDAGSSES